MRSKKEGEGGEAGEDEVEEEPRTAREGRRGEGDAVLEEVDDAGPLLGPWEDMVRKMTARLFRREARGIQSFFRVRNLPPQVPRLANPTAVIESACHGDDVGFRLRSVVALSHVTPSYHGAVGLEPDAVTVPA